MSSTPADVAQRGLRRGIGAFRVRRPQRLHLAAVLLALGLSVALAAALVEVREHWTTPGGAYRAVLKLALYHGLWLVFPLSLVATWRGLAALRARRWTRAAGAAAALALCGALAWARFVEPAQLQVVTTRLDAGCGVRVALLSDIHLGLYTRQPVLESLIAQLNALDVDAVLVAGDWTYEPRHDLKAAFAPWSRLRHRSYGVLGNHDEQQPGPPVQQAVRDALGAAGLQWTETRRFPLGACELVGIGDLYSQSALRDVVSLRVAQKRQPSPVPATRRIVLAHNPDSVHLLRPDDASLVLAGHTHGGQINLPLATDLVLSKTTFGGYRGGTYPWRGGRVFVTTGVGVGKLPLRFRAPPRVDLLEL